MSVNIYLILLLANYAISRTIAKEDGPLGIFCDLRKWLNDPKPEAPTEPEEWTDQTELKYNQQFDAYDNHLKFWRRSARGWLADMVNCPYCLSWYSGLFVVSLFVISSGIYQYIPLVYLATVGGANFLQSIEDK